MLPIAASDVAGTVIVGLVIFLAGPAVVLFIAGGKNRNPWGWAALTLFAPFLLAALAPWAYWLGVLGFIVLVAVLPARPSRTLAGPRSTADPPVAPASPHRQADNAAPTADRSHPTRPRRSPPSVDRTAARPVHRPVAEPDLDSISPVSCPECGSTLPVMVGERDRPRSVTCTVCRCVSLVENRRGFCAATVISSPVERWQALGWGNPRRVAEARRLLIDEAPHASSRFDAEIVVELGRIGTIDAAQTLCDYALKPDAAARNEAAQALARVGPAGRNAIGRRWEQSRDGGLAGLIQSGELISTKPARLQALTALLCDRLSAFTVRGSDRATALLAAAADSDPLIAPRATEALLRLRDRAEIDALCEIAYGSRPDHQARGIVSNAAYVAGSPPALHAVTLVAAGRAGELLGDATGRALLIDLALGELYPGEDDLQQGAEAALRGIADEHVIDDLCDIAMREPDGHAARACRLLAFTPNRQAHRALFFALESRFDDYERLDFDGTLLQVAYAEAAEPIRSRLREVLLGAGRSGLLVTAIAGERTATTAQLTPDEVRIMLKEGLAGENWPAVWSSVSSLPFRDAFCACLALAACGWTPGGDGQERLFREVTGLANLAANVPWARAVKPSGLLAGEPFRLPDGSSEASIHPAASLIYFVGPDRRDVWSIDPLSQSQRRHRMSSDAQIEKMAHAADGRLFTLLKPKRNSVRHGLFVEADGGHPVELGAITEDVTLFAPIDGQHILTVSSTSVLRVWRVERLDSPRPTRTIRQKRLLKRPRRVFFARDELSTVPWALLQSDDLLLFDFPDLRTLSWFKTSLTGEVTATAGTVAPVSGSRPRLQPRTLIVGNRNGTVRALSFHAGRTAVSPNHSGRLNVMEPSARRLRTSPEGFPVAALEWLDEGTLAVVWKDGHVELLDWAHGEVLEDYDAGLDDIQTAASCNAGKGLILLDSSGSYLTIDTRLRRTTKRLKTLLAKPANGCDLDDWRELCQILEIPGLPEENAGILRFARALLSRRFQHAVAVQAGAEPAHGEYDISISEAGG